MASPSRRPSIWKRVLARLDERGATFTALPERPGEFLAEWHEPGYPTPDGRPWQQIFRPGQRLYGSRAMLRAIARRAT